MEKLAPRHLAENWDNVGLLVGSLEQGVRNILVTLDITPTVLKYAIEHDVDLIISHHPIIFKGITNLRTDTPAGKLLTDLVRSGIAVYAAHTNLDIAVGGVNDVLAEKLQLVEVRPLSEHSRQQLNKLVVYVPRDHVEPVRAAITGAGAGHIGNYSHCTFQTAGTGTFLPLEGTNPFLGRPGNLEYVEEYRLETVVPASILSKVIEAMLQAHPYEEVAYDVFPLLNAGQTFGLGRVGKLQSPQSLSQLAAMVKASLALERVKVAGDGEQQVEVVAVCGGSGGSLINAAIAAGAHVLITGDVKYHEAQLAMAAGLSVIDAGHFATEQPVVAKLAQFLQNQAEANKWQVKVIADNFSKDIFNFW